MRFATIAACLALTLSAPIRAQEEGEIAGETAANPALETRLNDVVAVINGTMPPEHAFSDSFLATVPPAQLAALSDNLKTQFGDALGVETIDATGTYAANFALRFESAIGSGVVTLAAEEPHLVNGLRLTGFEPIDDNAGKIAADLAALPGSTAAWFGPLDGDAVFTHGDDDAQFAIGSTFKLYVLAALSRAVDEGRLAWDQAVPLSSKSLPSGIAQDWPDDAPVTLHTLATLMISISDNTATDTLIDVVGREAIEAELRASGHSDPAKTLPFLKTLEMFALKVLGQGEEYASADEARRRAILGEMDLAELDEDRFREVFTGQTPVLVDRIEWFTSMADQRALMRVLAADDDGTARAIMAVNEALTAKEVAEWGYVGFKGGSEPGVRNLSWLLRDKDGNWHMLAVSWNNTEAEIDTSTLMLLAQRILALAD